MIVTHHAFERWLEHHPQDEVLDILVALKTSEEIHGDLVRAITQRMVIQQGSTYFVPQTKMGILVVFDNRVITYLRLSPRQRNILFPESSPPPPPPPVESLLAAPPFMGDLQIKDVAFIPDAFSQNIEILRIKFMGASWEKVHDVAWVWMAEVGHAKWYAHVHPTRITVFDESGHIRRMAKIERNRQRSLEKVRLAYQNQAYRKYESWIVGPPTKVEDA